MSSAALLQHARARSAALVDTLPTWVRGCIGQRKWDATPRQQLETLVTEAWLEGYGRAVVDLEDVRRAQDAANDDRDKAHARRAIADWLAARPQV